MAAGVNEHVGIGSSGTSVDATLVDDVALPTGPEVSTSLADGSVDGGMVVSVVLVIDALVDAVVGACSVDRVVVDVVDVVDVDVAVRAVLHDAQAMDTTASHGAILTNLLTRRTIDHHDLDAEQAQRSSSGCNVS